MFFKNKSVSRNSFFSKKDSTVLGITNNINKISS